LNHFEGRDGIQKRKPFSYVMPHLHERKQDTGKSKTRKLVPVKDSDKGKIRGKARYDKIKQVKGSDKDKIREKARHDKIKQVKDSDKDKIRRRQDTTR
jgi:hypothetical protein